MKSVRHAVALTLRAAAVERDAQLNVSHRSRYSPSGRTLAVLAVSIGLTGTVFAQENPAPANNASLDEITVTGSRIRRTTDFDTPNPTTVVDADYLKSLGIV